VELTFEIDQPLLERAERALRRCSGQSRLLPQLGLGVAIVLAPVLPAAILAALIQWTAIFVGVSIYALLIAAIVIRARRGGTNATRGLEGVFTFSVEPKSLEVISSFGHVYRSAAAVNEVFVMDELILVFVDGKSGYLVIPVSAFRYGSEADAFADAIRRLRERGLENDSAPIVPTEFESGVLDQVAWEQADHVEPPMWRLIGSIMAVGLAFLGGILVFDPFLHVALGAIGLVLVSASLLLAAIQLLASPGKNLSDATKYRATLTEDGLCFLSWPNQEIFRFWNTVARVKRDPRGIAIQCDVAPHLFWIPVTAFPDELEMNQFATQAERLIAAANEGTDLEALEAQS
jgi:hypothetical protein